MATRRPSSFTPILPVAEQAALEGIRASGKDALARAKKHAPVDDKTLVNSGRVKDDGVSLVQVSFTAPHAWLQHERTDYHHLNGGGSKYLETAVDEIDVETDVGRALGSALGG
ncbi:hypothetical protein CH252_19150 [Rhodococcus sp. 06-1477-1B]|nr:hypothetical protein CH252_19150 [Rhodococcus sp. 06-1477-1B]